MKENKRKRSSEKSAPERNRYMDGASRLDDFGLEPPKIYRDSQRKLESDRQRRSADDKRNITTAEKRKKQAKKRKKKNKLRRVVISVFVGVLTVAVLVTVALTQFFNITDFTVTGTKKYVKADVMDNLTIDVGESLFLSDFRKAEEHLERSLPYVYKAELRRKLPSTVEINITDAKVAYSIKKEDKTFILLDDNFKVLETNAKKGGGIRILKADIAEAKEGSTISFRDKKVLGCLQTLSEVLKNKDFSEITAIYSYGINKNYAVYDHRITFRLGNCDNLEKKLYQGFAACDKLNKTSPNVHGYMKITGDKQLYFTEE